MRSIAFFVAAIFGFSGCTTPPLQAQKKPIPKQSQFYEAECALGTQSSNIEQFHALIHYPFEHSLRFPGMIVGIEKSADNLVKKGAENAAQKLVPPESREENFLHGIVFGGSKSMFISHVVESNKDGIGIDVPLYNIYNPETIKSGREPRPDGLVNCKGEPVVELDAFEKSWDAVSLVKKTLSDRLAEGKYTDVIVISMGWNTNQIEAVQNFNSLVHQIKGAAKSDVAFNPYVIGITWPSEWFNSWVEPVVRGISFINKANDADEVGVGWMRAIIQHGVLEVTQDPRYKSTRVTVLGHSFGARATSMAVCHAGILKAPEDRGFTNVEPEPNSVSWLVGLQGAYSLNRYLPGGAGFYGLSYGDCPLVKHHLLTASENDSVAQVSSDVLKTSPFVGQISAWHSMKDGVHSQMFNFFTADSSGGVKPVEGLASEGKWNYIDASNLVFYNAYGTSAGAHSDIYRAPMGVMLWSFIGASK